MTYKFPPIWFAAGSASLIWLCIALSVTAISMVGSVVYLWNWPPRSPANWWVVGALWFVPVISIVATIAVRERSQILLQDVPPLIFIPTMIVIVGMPLPALAAAFREIEGKCQAPHGFHDLLTWGAMVSLLAFIFVMQCSGVGLWTPHEARARLQCQNNLKNVSLALINHATVNNSILPAARIHTDHQPDQSWRVAVLPFLELPRQAYSYNAAEPWVSSFNTLVAQHSTPQMYLCPSVVPGYRQDPAGRWYTAYAAITGPNTAFPIDKRRSLENFPDGLSHTVLLAEACGQQIVWTEPRDIEVTSTNVGFNLPGSRLGHSPAVWSSYHQGGAMTAFADGGVRSLSPRIDPRVLRALLTADGGEQLDENESDHR